MVISSASLGGLNGFVGRPGFPLQNPQRRQLVFHLLECVQNRFAGRSPSRRRNWLSRRSLAPAVFRRHTKFREAAAPAVQNLAAQVNRLVKLELARPALALSVSDG